MTAEVQDEPLAPRPMVGIRCLLHSGKREYKLLADVVSSPLLKLVPVVGSRPRLELEAGGHLQPLTSPLLPQSGRVGGHPRGSGISVISSIINYCILITARRFMKAIVAITSAECCRLPHHFLSCDLKTSASCSSHLVYALISDSWDGSQLSLLDTIQRFMKVYLASSMIVYIP